MLPTHKNYLPTHKLKNIYIFKLKKLGHVSPFDSYTYLLPNGPCVDNLLVHVSPPPLVHVYATSLPCRVSLMPRQIRCFRLSENGCFRALQIDKYRSHLQYKQKPFSKL